MSAPFGHFLAGPSTSAGFSHDRVIRQVFRRTEYFGRFFARPSNSERVGRTEKFRNFLAGPKRLIHNRMTRKLCANIHRAQCSHSPMQPQCSRCACCSAGELAYSLSIGARSSAGQSSGLIIRRSQVRILPGAPLASCSGPTVAEPSPGTVLLALALSAFHSRQREIHCPHGSYRRSSAGCLASLRVSHPCGRS
jgi:hypothetical protein